MSWIEVVGARKEVVDVDAMEVKVKVKVGCRFFKDRWDGVGGLVGFGWTRHQMEEPSTENDMDPWLAFPDVVLAWYLFIASGCGGATEPADMEAPDFFASRLSVPCLHRWGCEPGVRCCLVTVDDPCLLLDSGEGTGPMTGYMTMAGLSELDYLCFSS